MVVNQLIALGDIHGKWDRVDLILDNEPSYEDKVISTGDLCTYDFKSRSGKKVLFCPGNHENYHAIKSLREENNKIIKPIFEGDIEILGNRTRIASLHGVHSSYVFQNNQHGLFSKFYDQNGFQKALSLADIDILITHEAPLGLGVIKNGKDLGNSHINDLINTLRPRVCFFGHHHQVYSGKIGNTNVYGLDMPHRSYAVLNLDTYCVDIVRSEMNSKNRYEYDWEKANEKK